MADTPVPQICGILGVGGAGRDRTADLLIANEALSQLSYGPNRGRHLKADAARYRVGAIYGAAFQAVNNGAPGRRNGCGRANSALR